MLGLMLHVWCSFQENSTVSITKNNENYNLRLNCLKVDAEITGNAYNKMIDSNVLRYQWLEKICRFHVNLSYAKIDIYHHKVDKSAPEIRILGRWINYKNINLVVTIASAFIGNVIKNNNNYGDDNNA